MDWKTRLTMLAVALILAFAARFAAADPVTVTWTNTAIPGTAPVTKAMVCGDVYCHIAQTICLAGATCETEHDLPPGVYDDALLMVSSLEFDLWWSLPVPGTLVVEAQNPSGGVCQHDSNGDGVVSTVDFGSFYHEFRNGCGQ